MVTKPEHLANQKDLFQVAQDHGKEMQERIDAVEDLHVALKLSKEVATKYYVSVETLLNNALHEVGTSATKHYAEELGIQLDDKEITIFVNSLIAEQRQQDYYGLSLDDRLRINQIRLEQSLRQAAGISRKAPIRAGFMGRVLYGRGPFGNHIAVDKRVLLSESVRLEHNVALLLGERANAGFVKWSLSEHHQDEDICDALATNITKEVDDELRHQGRHIDPRGVYFVNDCPNLPHPNCQCELSFMLPDGRLTGTRVRRTISAITNLIKRLRRQ